MILDNINHKTKYELPYDFDSLEPVISLDANKQHFYGHLIPYFEKLNKLIEEHNIYHDKTIIEIIELTYGNPDLIAFYNTASQIYAHILFWESLISKKNTKSINNKVSNCLKELIENSFRTMENFHKQLITKGTEFFGNGWLWVILTSNDKVEIITTINAFNPINMHSTKLNLFCIDLWEHAYYLQYRHKKAEYLNLIYQIIDWQKVSKRLI